jgi:hypothetical protein
MAQSSKRIPGLYQYRATGVPVCRQSHLQAQCVKITVYFSF